MKLALDDLHQSKLRKARQDAQALLNQWQQTIRQIQEAETQADCALLPNDFAIESPVEMSRQLAEANYLTVVTIRDRAGQGISEGVNFAELTLNQEINRQKNAYENSKTNMVATEAARETALSLAKFHCEKKTGSQVLPGETFLPTLAVAAVVFEIGFVIWSSQLENSISAFFIRILCIVGGWLVGVLVVLPVLGAIKGFERLSADMKFERETHRISREFDARLSNHNATIAETANRLMAAQAARSLLPPYPSDFVIVE